MQSIAHETFTKVVAQRYKTMDTDVDVVVGTQTFNCHKEVLTLWSDYFRAALSSPLTTTDSLTIPQSEFVSTEAFEVIHKYMYSGTLDTSQEDILAVVKTAHYLQMAAIVELCADYVMSKKEEGAITIDTALSFSQLEAEDLELFRCVGDHYLAKWFFRSDLDDSLLTMSAGVLRRLLVDANLRVRNEECLLSFLLEWVLEDPVRYEYAEEMFSHVKLGLVSTTTIAKIKDTIELRPYLKSLEPVLTDIVFSSIDQNYTWQSPNKEKYYGKRTEALIVTKNKKQVLVSLAPGRKSLVWDSVQHWREGDLDMEDCNSNLALGDNVLYKLDSGDRLNIREMNSGTWVPECSLPECFTKSGGSGGKKGVLVYLKPHLYIFYPEQSLRYHTGQKAWHLFDTKLPKWDCLHQGAALKDVHTNITKMVLTGTNNVTTEQGEQKVVYVRACGNPEDGWTVKDVFRSTEQFHLTSVNLIVEKEEQAFYLVTNVIFKWLPFVSRYRSTAGPEWAEVNTTKMCGIKVLKSNTNKRYTLFKNILLPLAECSGFLGVDALKSNPACMHMYHEVPIPMALKKSTVMLLPMGLC